MQKRTAYHKNFKIPAIMLISLGISAASFAQPMEKPFTQISSPVKAVEKDLNLPSFEVEVAPLTSDSSKLLVSIANPDRKKLRISLISPSNWEVYNRDINDEEYRKLFNFITAEDGAYTLIIAEGKKKVKKQININTYREEVIKKMEVLNMQ